MFRAIGFLITLYALSVFFENAFEAFERAVTETFITIEAAVIQSQRQINELQ